MSLAFSPATVSSLASRDTVVPGAALATLANLVESNEHATLADAFERAYAVLLKSYRNEYVYKNVLVSKIVFGRHSPRTASALLELPVGSSIADLLVLNGTSSVYEIKTDLDNLDRLKSQVADYLTCFENVNVVSSLSRIDAVERIVPRRVGLIAIRNSGALSTVRPSIPGLEGIRLDRLFEVLRRAEVIEVLRNTIGYELDVPPGDVWRRTKALFTALPVSQAHSEALLQLRARGLRSSVLASDPALPHSLRAAAYSASLGPAPAGRLKARLRMRATQIGAISE